MDRADKNVDEECPLCIEIMTRDSPLLPLYIVVDAIKSPASLV